MALHSEGCRVLNDVPKHMFDDRGLVMALIIETNKALEYASDELRHDASIMKLICSAQQHKRFADLTLSDASNFIEAIRGSCGVAVADNLYRYVLCQRVQTH
jgi:hypothetical protein